MNEYTASNGYTVDTSCGVSIRNGVGNERHVLGLYSVVALREFFLHERDEQLGRWRWPENSDYVVYPQGPEASVYHELTGTWGQWSRAEALAYHGMDNLAAAARAYFDAHPEPKPWHDAKPGEVWLLEFSGFEGDEAPWIVRIASIESVEFVYPQNGNAIPLSDETITAARRIWPEPE